MSLISLILCSFGFYAVSSKYTECLAEQIITSQVPEVTVSIAQQASDSTIRATLKGPTSTSWAVSFGGTGMVNSYTVVTAGDTGSVSVTENSVFRYGISPFAESTFSAEPTVTDDGGVRTVVFTRPFTATGVDFTTFCNGELPMVAAKGISLSSFTYHSAKGPNSLTSTCGCVSSQGTAPSVKPTSSFTSRPRPATSEPAKPSGWPTVKPSPWPSAKPSGWPTKRPSGWPTTKPILVPSKESMVIINRKVTDWYYSAVIEGVVDCKSSIKTAEIRVKGEWKAADFSWGSQANLIAFGFKYKGVKYTEMSAITLRLVMNNGKYITMWNKVTNTKYGSRFTTGKTCSALDAPFGGVNPSNDGDFVFTFTLQDLVIFGLVCANLVVLAVVIRWACYGKSTSSSNKYKTVAMMTDTEDEQVMSS